MTKKETIAIMATMYADGSYNPYDIKQAVDNAKKVYEATEELLKNKKLRKLS